MPSFRLDAVVPALPRPAGRVLTRALVFERLVVGHVADTLFDRALDPLPRGRGFLREIAVVPRRTRIVRVVYVVVEQIVSVVSHVCLLTELEQHGCHDLLHSTFYTR